MGRYANSSGRGNNSRNSNAGRGHDRHDNSERELKFSPQSTAYRGRFATNATVKEHVIQEIQKKYKNGSDVAKSLRDGNLIDIKGLKPIRSVSLNPDAMQRSIEQGGFDIDYQEELRRYLDRKEILTENMKKAYTMIFSNYCTKTMQQRVEEHPKYKSEIEDDPIKLLEVISSSTHDPIRAQYPFISMTDSILRLLNIKQHDEEDLVDYVKRFKQQRDIVKNQIGTRFLDYFFENTQEFKSANTSEQTAIKAKAFEYYCAYLLMRGANRNKYGSLMKGFVNQFSLGNDQYPSQLPERRMSSVTIRLILNLANI